MILVCVPTDSSIMGRNETFEVKAPAKLEPVGFLRGFEKFDLADDEMIGAEMRALGYALQYYTQRVFSLDQKQAGCVVSFCIVCDSIDEARIINGFEFLGDFTGMVRLPKGVPNETQGT